MRSVRFSRVRATACFMRSKNEGFSSVLPNKVWIIANAHYTGRSGNAVRMIMADVIAGCLDSAFRVPIRLEFDC